MRHVVVGLGEVLWDIFPDERRLGGAPANVAYHIEVLGEEGVIASRVGSDELGSDLVEQLTERQLRTDAIQIDPDHPTGTVQVSFEDGDPRYEIVENVSWDAMEWTHDLALLATSSDAVAFGTLCQRSEATRSVVRTFLRSMKPDALRVLDINLRPPFVDEDVIRDSIELADVVKLNRDESRLLAKMYGADIEDPGLLSQLDVDIVVVTKGADGCTLVTEGERVDEAGIEVDTSNGDAVGVGDAFVAAVIHEILRDAPLGRIARFANRYAAIVAQKRGGMPGMIRDL